MKTLSEMQQEVYDWCVTKGWEPDENRVWGDEVALLHSEASEALEEYRVHGLRPYYEPDNETRIYTNNQIYGDCKPLGVPSEFADVLIRLLHYTKVHDIDLDGPTYTAYHFNDRSTFGHGISILHSFISTAFDTANNYKISRYAVKDIYMVLRSLCDMYGVDLFAEYEAKMAYNHTRAYRHGGKLL